MKTRSTTSLPRQTAEERRDAILDAAIAEFATYGLHETSTETIAKRVGISQPYVLRLFGTKKDLFIAALKRVCDRLTATFQEAAAADPDHALEAMGHSYMALMSRHELFLLLQAFAASNDHEVQRVARDRYAELYRFVARV